MLVVMSQNYVKYISNIIYVEISIHTIHND